MDGKIRKISVGPDFKNGAMHFLIGKQIAGDTIHDITEKDGVYRVYLINHKNEVRLWKKWTGAVPVHVEYER